MSAKKAKPTVKALVKTLATEKCIIEWARERGVEPRQGDFRFTAHECFHGIDLGLVMWDSDSIHYAVLQRDRGHQVALEVRARAGEWLACEAHGIPYDVHEWALIASMEAAKGLAISLSGFPLVKSIELARDDKSVRAIVKQILGAKTVRRPSPSVKS